jgi:filamentous hemagglutinin
VQLSKLQDAELATCDKRGDCATLKNDVMQGRDAMLTLVNTGKLPEAYAGAMDMQYMGQRLATDATFRKQVANSVEYMNWCGKNASACNQDQLQKAAGMSMLVLGPVIAVNPQLVAAVLLAQNGERASSAVIGGGVNVLAQALSSGQVDSVDVLKAAATAYATAGASLATTTAVNVGAEGAVSWAKDESQSEALSKMLLSALGTAVGFKVGDLTKGQFAKMTDSYSATMKAKPTGFLTIEGPYSRSALPSTMGNMVGSGATETTSTYLQNYIDQFRLVGAAK